MTAPTGTASYAPQDTLAVAWNTNAAVGGGEFAIWVTHTSGWYVGKIVPAHGASANYTSNVTLNVPLGTGYSVVVGYRPTAGSGAWTVFGTSSGTFDVAGLVLTVTAPSGTGTHAVGDSLAVAWNTNAPVGTGEFAVWVTSSTGWYVGQLVPANGASPNYTANVTLNVPAGTGYSVTVGYRPTAGVGAWTVFGTSSGSFDVTGFSINVTAPTGTGTHAAGSSLAVSWTAGSIVSTGEFAIWITNSTGWYIGQLVPANGASPDYTANVTLNVPVGTGYSVTVGYRPIAGVGAWTIFGVSPGTFNVN